MRELTSVPVEPLRERFLELHDQGLSYEEVARRMGWRGTRPGKNVQRSLGLGRFAGHTTNRMHYATAVRMAKALGMEPWEAGV